MTDASNAIRGEALRGAWAALFLLWLINILKNIDRVLMGVLAPGVKAEFQLSDAQIGLLALGFSISYAIVGVPLGRLADLFSRRRLIAAVTAFWSLMTAVCGVAGNYVALLSGRIGIAVGEAGLLPAALAMVADQFSPQLRNIAISLLFSGSAVGVFLGLSLGGWLAAHYGWRNAFLGLGIPGLLMAIVAWLWLRDPPRGASDTLGYQEVVGETWLQAMKSLLARPLFVWIMITSAFNTYAHLGMVQWLPSFFQRSHHMSVDALGIGFGTAFSLGMLTGHLCGGALATRIARRGVFAPLMLCVWMNLAAAPVYLLALWMADARLSLLLVMLGTFLVATVHPGQQAAESNALPPRLRGMGQASKSLAVGVVTGGLPWLVGVLSDAIAPATGEDSLRWALSIGLVSQLLAALAGWRAWRIGQATEATTG